MEALTLQLFASLFFYVCVYLSILYLNDFASTNQVYHVVDDPPLYDRGHKLIPLINKIYPDIGVGCFIAYFVLRWGVKYPYALMNYLLMVSFLFIGRVVILSVTQLPPALPGCSTVKPGEKLHYLNALKESWHMCIDYMYSGHTLHSVIIVLFILYLSKSWVEKSIAIFAVIIEMVLIIGSRIHYTADVLVGALVSILIFFAWPGLGNIKTHINNGGIYGAILSRK